MHICNLISLFIKFLHMFLLPDVVSAAIAGVAFIEDALSVTSVTTELTEILNMILSYKSYLAFWWHIIYVLHVLIYIHISEYVRTIFFDIFFPFFSIYQDVYLNVNSLYIKFLYKFFLHDIASSSVAGFMFVTLVLSVICTFVEDDEANKV